MPLSDDEFVAQMERVVGLIDPLKSSPDQITKGFALLRSLLGVETNDNPSGNPNQFDMV